MARSSSTSPRRTSNRKGTSQAGSTLFTEEHKSEGVVSNLNIRDNISIGNL